MKTTSLLASAALAAVALGCVPAAAHAGEPCNSGSLVISKGRTVASGDTFRVGGVLAHGRCSTAPKVQIQTRQAGGAWKDVRGAKVTPQGKPQYKPFSVRVSLNKKGVRQMRAVSRVPGKDIVSLPQTYRVH